MVTAFTLRFVFTVAVVFLKHGLYTKAQSFVRSYKGCVSGSSGNSCPGIWEVKGGPGSVGNDRANYPTLMTCSPSCVQSNNPEVCSLIVVMHGNRMRPSYMQWYMLGYPLNGPGGETYAEGEEYGGPFCIAFPKAASNGWIYRQVGADADYLEAFILWARDTWPIDHEAVSLHGYSSGGAAISYLMYTNSKVEPLVASVATYASGNVLTPPTTKAAYLIVMGTHDKIVVYKNVWKENRSYPSCNCLSSWCSGSPKYFLQGEQLATAIANIRGYDGSLFGKQPAISSKLDLISENPGKCQNLFDACISPYKVDTGYSCTTVPIKETDVLEYPIDDDSNSGVVTLWRINLYDHAYPNKKRQSYGATEFFFQLRIFFYANRGRKKFDTSDRTVQQVTTNKVCADPDSTFFDYDFEIFRKRIWNSSMTHEECKNHCLLEKRCAVAFWFVIPSNSRVCEIHYEDFSCKRTKSIDWESRQFEATMVVSPSPTNSPTTSQEPSESPSQNGNVCNGLDKNSCQKEVMCNYGKRKIRGLCAAKKSEYAHNCTQHVTEGMCLKGDHTGLCDFVDGVCSHRCDGLDKKVCSKLKNANNGEKICKSPKITNPCKGCNTKTTCPK